MKTLTTLLLFVAIAALPSTAYTQRYEVHPYAGGFFPGPNGTLGDFRSEGIYGVKSGVNVTTNFQVGGHLGYVNHLEPNRSNAVSQNVALDGNRHSTRAVIWEGEGSYQVPISPMAEAGVMPYAVIAVGGLTAMTNAAGSVLLSEPQRTIMLENGDTFLTFSYGGGVKVMRLLGPLGFRGDIRGRTIPNFLGNSTSWPELTAGFLFNWGER